MQSEGERSFVSATLPRRGPAREIRPSGFFVAGSRYTSPVFPVFPFHTAGFQVAGNGRAKRRKKACLADAFEQSKSLQLALDAVGAAEHGGVRAPAVPQELGDRNGNGQTDPWNHAEGRDASEADHR